MGLDSHQCVHSFCVLVLVFCVLGGTVGVLKAFLFAGLVVVSFAVADYLAPASWRAGSAGVEREAAVAACRLGLPEAAVHALSTYAYVLSGGGGDIESGDGGEVMMCSVCLEEMVRWLPACKQDHTAIKRWSGV